MNLEDMTDSTYMRYLEWSNSQRQVEWWLLGAGGREEVENSCLMGIEFQLGKVKKILEMDGGDGHTII